MKKEVLIPLMAALLAAKFAIDHVGDVDLFWHLRLGLDLLTSGAFAEKPPYTWTFDAPWPAFDWLSQLVMGGAFKIGGYLGLALGKAFLAIAIALCLYRAALLRANGNARAAGLALFLTIFLLAANFSSRPLFLAHCLLALEILILEEARSGRRWPLALLPPMFVLWGNLHGSWPFGLGPIAVFTAECLAPLRFKFWRPIALDALTPTGSDAGQDNPPGDLIERARRWVVSRAFVPANPLLALSGALAFVGCLLAQLCTPDPARFIARPFQWIGQNTEVWMTEWAAVPADHPAFWLLWLAFGLIALALIRGRRPRSLIEVIFVALTFAMALAKFRLITCFAIPALPLLAGLLSERVSPEGFQNRRANAALACVSALLLGGVSCLNLARADELAEGVVPRSAVDALEQSGRSQERGFNYFDWGGYLVLRQIPTFVDGRLEPFEANGTLGDYMRVEHEADIAWLENRGVTWILTRADLPLAQALLRRDGWSLAHKSQDESGAELWLREVSSR